MSFIIFKQISKQSLRMKSTKKVAKIISFFYLKDSFLVLIVAGKWHKRRRDHPGLVFGFHKCAGRNGCWSENVWLRLLIRKYSRIQKWKHFRTIYEKNYFITRSGMHPITFPFSSRCCFRRFPLSLLLTSIRPHCAPVAGRAGHDTVFAVWDNGKWFGSLKSVASILGYRKLKTELRSFVAIPDCFADLNWLNRPVLH